MGPPERRSTPHATAHPAPLSGLPLGRPPHTLSTVIPAEAGIQVRPPTKNAEPRGSDGLEALPRLASGETVTNVALDLGYDSPSAFTAMFRRILGASPRDYLRTTAEGGRAVG